METSAFCYEKKDPLTGQKFVTNRIDQRFANRKNQIKFNNRLAIRKRQSKAPYDKSLDLNRTILKKVLGKEKEIIKSKDYLEALNYNFHLSLYQTTIDKATKMTAKGIYEFLIIPLTDNQYKITTYEALFGN